MEYINAILIILSIIFSLISLESEKRISSIIFMAMSAIAIGLLYFNVGAFYAAIFQLLVYAGVLTVLFAATAYFIESPLEKADSTKIVEVGMNE